MTQDQPPSQPVRITSAHSSSTGSVRSYGAKLAQARAATGLPYAGLAPYYAMCYLLRFRWLRLASSIGELLQLVFGTNFAVNSVLAAVYSQRRNPKGECRALMRIVPAHRADTDLLARAGESAAYAGDAASLAVVRDLSAHESLPLLSYLSGLLAFLQGQANYHAHFGKCVRAFFGLDDDGAPPAAEKSVRELSRQYTASGRNLPGFVRQAYNISELSSIDALLQADCPSPVPAVLSEFADQVPVTGPGHPDAVVLISCSDGYLGVFADHYVSTFRRQNANIIHFHVLANDVEVTRAYLMALQKRHVNVHYSIECVAGHSQTYITLARFLICRALMKRYSRDVFISDIDLQFDGDFDLNAISSALRGQAFDFGLCDLGYVVPWAKYGAGISYFRIGNQATDVFLDLLARHLMSRYAEGGFFSLDQTGILLVREYMETRGHVFRVLNLYTVMDVGKLINIPKHLERRKIDCKWGSGGPQ